MITYPTNRLLGVIDRPADASAAVGALAAAGVAAGDVTVLAGEEGRDRLASLGSEPNLLSRVVRLFQFALMDQTPDFLVYERAILDGRAVVAIAVVDRDRGDAGRHTAADGQGADGDAADGEDPDRATSGRGDGQRRGEEGKHGGDGRGRGPGEREMEREPGAAADRVREDHRDDRQGEQGCGGGETGERDPPVVATSDGPSAVTGARDLDRLHARQ